MELSERKPKTNKKTFCWEQTEMKNCSICLGLIVILLFFEYDDILKNLGIQSW